MLGVSKGVHPLFGGFHFNDSVKFDLYLLVLICSIVFICSIKYKGVVSMAEPIVLSKEQAAELANQVVAMLTPKPADAVDETVDVPEGAVWDKDTQAVVYTDPLSKKLDAVEAALIETLPRGHCIYRGRNGTQSVNHTVESLNYLNDFRKNRKQFRTRETMR